MPMRTPLKSLNAGRFSGSSRAAARVRWAREVPDAIPIKMSVAKTRNGNLLVRLRQSLGEKKNIWASSNFAATPDCAAEGKPGPAARLTDPLGPVQIRADDNMPSTIHKSIFSLTRGMFALASRLIVPVAVSAESPRVD